ncbi:MAG: aminopeptidase P family protein [Actinobacteria bacterium]|nr:MAG: aminopeptidase P family protein [Actinomycetota bacterium]
MRDRHSRGLSPGHGPRGHGANGEQHADRIAPCRTSSSTATPCDHPSYGTRYHSSSPTASSPGLDIIATAELGEDELYAQGLQGPAITLEVIVRACREVGIQAAAVPPHFPVEVADHLRANGIDLTVDRDLFDNRRRSKNETELGGIRRAQKACETALDAARDLLRRAQPNGAGLEVDGAPLTSERIKRVIEGVFADHDVEASEMIVSHGPQTAVGHDMGSGQIRPNEPIVFDLFPRDKQTGCYADMTRTYVVGEPSEEVKEWYGLVKDALDRSTAAVKPGANGRKLFELVCNIFQQAGYKTALNKEPGEVLEDGFIHSLGHGVGLEVHELPSMSRTGHDLVPGDVITIEPGLYRSGYGGLRLEDLVLVTKNGYEVITDYPYDLTP